MRNVLVLLEEGSETDRILSAPHTGPRAELTVAADPGSVIMYLDKSGCDDGATLAYDTIVEIDNVGKALCESTS